MLHRIFWGVVTPTNVDGVPEVMFASEGRCRYSVEEAKKEHPELEGNLKVVRVRLRIENIEQGGS